MIENTAKNRKNTQHERRTVLTLDNNFQLGIINYSRLNKRLELSRLAYGPIHMGYTVDSVLFKLVKWSISLFRVCHIRVLARRILHYNLSPTIR